MRGKFSVEIKLNKYISFSFSFKRSWDPPKQGKSSEKSWSVPIRLGLNTTNGTKLNEIAIGEKCMIKTLKLNIYRTNL